MVAQGITRARLPAGNAVICTLDDPRTPALAASIGNTRSAAALDLWGDQLAGAVVAIGNAPTALFRLLELLDAGAPPPAAIIGLPVGFVGAAESKDGAVRRYARAQPDPGRAGWAAARWRWRRSTRWPATRNDPPHHQAPCTSSASGPATPSC